MTEPKHTAGDCDKKGPHAGHDLSVELQKAAELRFLVLFANELISNLINIKTLNLTHIPQMIEV